MSLRKSKRWDEHDLASVLAKGPTARPSKIVPRPDTKSANKFHAEKVPFDGFVFDSGGECARYKELKLLQRAKEITRLKVHPQFSIHDDEGEHVAVLGLDFRYYDREGKRVLEDFKSKPTMTRDFKNKLKHLEAQLGVKVRIVMR